VNGRELIKRLEQEGWKLDRVSSSHHVMVKSGKRPIVVPVHGKKDISRGLLAAIYRQAGLKE
jgi:predicted RNA binding protein YcfA (HicA-like mRNA interferase family)